jgi:lipopolysaccharide/colanic/teichoic acid biosynthesis glycosyltransferase
VNGTMLVRAPEPHRGYDAVRRTVDLVVCLIALPFATVLVAGAALAVAVAYRCNPFFVQERVGLLGRPIRIVKVKTMLDGSQEHIPEGLNETEGPTFKSRADPRRTPLGKLLRKTSIDELPQLLNVVAGGMTLVGPRPALPQEVAAYARPHLERLTVVPGITGLWQVSGRSEIGFRRWMALDRAYVRKRSTLLDLWILLRTPLAVVSMRGAW